MSATDDDLRPFCGLADFDDVRLQASAGLWTLVWDLLGLRQKRLDAAEVEEGVPGVVLLHDAGDDVALATCVLLVLHVALDLADALHHHLARSLRRDATEILWRVVPLTDDVAIVVELLGNNANVERLVDDDVCLFAGFGHALVGRLEPVGQSLEQHVGRNPLFGRKSLQRLHHLGGGHRSVLVVLFAGPHSNTVRALSISSNATNSLATVTPLSVTV